MKNLIMALVLGGFVLIMYGCNLEDNAFIPVSNDGQRWGFIDRKGQYVINTQFEDADFFSDGLAKIKSGNGKTGYINYNGEYVIPATYKNGTAFNNGLAFVVADGGLPTCIDKKGNTIFVLNIAKYVSSFSEGLALFVTEDGAYGFIDKNGNIVFNAQFEAAFPFSGGFARIWQKKDAGFIDKTGRIMINPQFKTVGNFSEDKAAFSDGKQYGYVNTKGTYVINPQFDDAGKFSSGMAAIKQGKSYGYINQEGRLIINPQFDRASSFSDGLAAVQSGNKYGYVNKDGKYEINTQFEYAGDFNNGTALVRGADKWGIINKKGRYVVNPQFNHVKLEPSIDASPDYVESDYYDTSEFIKLFFEREAGNTFDGINASTTLEGLSNHPNYGANVNARSEFYADYNGSIPITREIAIGYIKFHFKTPIYKTVESYNNWGYLTTNKQFDFTATPDAIVYQFILSGKASEKRSAIVSALKTEIERRYGQSMRSINAGQEIFSLYQGIGNLSFAIEGSNVTLHIAFNDAYFSGQFQ